MTRGSVSSLKDAKKVGILFAAAIILISGFFMANLVFAAAPQLYITPSSGQKGTKFIYTGNGFTPNGSIKEIITKPDGIQYSPLYYIAGSDGVYVKWYDSSTASIFGTYTIYWIDQTTGRQSNSVGETILIPTSLPKPTAKITTNLSSIPYNSPVTISWTSTDATSCIVNPTGWTGTSGSQTETLTASKTYTLNCSGQGGSASDTITINASAPAPQTLFVSLSASPSSITASQSVSLTANVSGTAQGTINYTFYCNRSDSGTNITSGWDAKFDGVFDNPKIAVCNYQNAGTYTAKVIAERGSAPPAEARISINVTSSPIPACTQNWQTGVWSACVNGQQTRTVTDSNNCGTTTGKPNQTQSCPTPSPTLSVSSFSANPASGNAPLNGVSLTAAVIGSAQGTINYTFYCNRSDSGTNITSGWNAKFDSVSDNPKTASNVCNYQNAGTYTAKVIAERGSAPPAEAHISISVVPSIIAPVINPVLYLSPTSGPKGTKFTFAGIRFTPNGVIREIITKPDGTQYAPNYYTANTDGSRDKLYDSSTASIFGTYTIYWVDESTSKQSNPVYETISAY